MTSTNNTDTGIERLLTTKEAAAALRVSRVLPRQGSHDGRRTSIRAVRYSATALLRCPRRQQRQSTREAEIV